MKNERLWNRAALRALLCLSLACGLAACVPEDDPDEGTDNNNTQTECPTDEPVRCADDTCATDAEACLSEDQCAAERPYRCGDGSCRADAAACPDDEELPEIDGDIVALSPQTILAHAPEQVEVDLAVGDAGRVKELLDDGATWQVELETVSGTETYDAAAEALDDLLDADYRLSFTPELADGPQHVNVSITLTVEATADSEGKVYAWGQNKLRYRGDASALEFDGRESFRLEGVENADRVWSGDLDGDGYGDFVIYDPPDVEKVERVLRVYKCGPDECEPVGTSRGEGGPVLGQIVAPDMGMPDEPSGFLGAHVTERTTDGDISAVDVFWLEILEDNGQLVLQETSETIAMGRAGAQGRLHEQTLEPRLIWSKDDDAYRPGLMISRTIAGAADTIWSTVLIDVDGIVADHHEKRGFDGLDEAERLTALDGTLATCLDGDTLGETPEAVPQGMILSAFELDGEPMLAAGSLDPTEGPMQVFSVDAHFDARLLGDAGGDARYGSIRCKLADLDDDGREDLVVGLADTDAYARLGDASGRPASLLVALGIEKTDIKRGMTAPALLVEDVDADDWDARATVGFGSFSISKRSARTGRNPQTGKEIKIAARLSFDLDVDERISVEPVNDPPVVAKGVTFFDPDFNDPDDDGDGFLTLLEGDDRVLRKKPGRTTYANITLERGLIGSNQIADEEGSIVLGHLAPTLEENQGEGALLIPTDPEDILAWLSSTGPYVPLQMPDGGGSGRPVLNDIVAVHTADSGIDKASPKLMQLRFDDQGTPTSVVSGDIVREEGQDMDTKEYDLDTSQVELRGKNVVKFKAGAELSKAVNAAAPDDTGDCDDGDPATNPADGCPAPGQVLLVLELDTGEVLTGVLDLDDDNDGVIELQEPGLRADLLAELGLDEGSDLSALETSTHIGHDGIEPIVFLRGALADDDGVDEVTVAVGRDCCGRKVIKKRRREGDSLYGDATGDGATETVECKMEWIELAMDGERVAQCRATPLGADEDGVEFSETPARGDVIDVIDVDGDGCADLVTDAGELISSRCDGSFEPVAVELGPWAAHLAKGNAGQGRAQDYNSSRSNKPNTIWAGGGDDGDPGPALPFYDGLAIPLW